MERWFVVHTQPNGETKAVAHLERQNLHVYLPRFLKRRRHARRTDWTPRPLFPRYLFVRMDLEVTRWRAINSTVGVNHLVCNGNRPLPVDDGVIADIRSRENESGFVVLNTRNSFRAGQAVRINVPAFDDCIGLFEDMSDDDRVTVLLDLLGRTVRVRLPLDGINAVA
ncbi:MAG: transcriptional activator RfaH [Rhodospirillales bacterium]|nr:transcriptional activator RfaH [Rhodospirillales bacterium]